MHAAFALVESCVRHSSLFGPGSLLASSIEGGEKGLESGGQDMTTEDACLYVVVIFSRRDGSS